MAKSTNDKRKKLQKKADRLYQEIGRANNSHCLICGGTYSCLHHYFPKSVCGALRYNINNGIPICVGCHMGIHSRYDPAINNKILEVKGKEWLEELEEIRKTVKISTTIGYYEEVIENLNNLLTNK